MLRIRVAREDPAYTAAGQRAQFVFHGKHPVVLLWGSEVRVVARWRLLVLAIWLAAYAASVQALDLSGKVVGVIDGDTVDLLTDAKQVVRARLAGIDAPERRQPFGDAAKRALSELVFSRRATLSGEKTDRYGRRIAKVLVDGRDANLAMVRLGYAWHYKKYELEQSTADRRLYAAAQIEAMRERRGLWRDTNPVAPWDFRAQKHTRAVEGQ